MAAAEKREISPKGLRATGPARFGRPDEAVAAAAAAAAAAFLRPLRIFLPVWCSCLIFLAVTSTESAGSDSPDEEFGRVFSRASCDFALDLLKATTTTKRSEENVVISPSSVSVLLAILQQGAENETSAQLEKVVRLSAENSRIGYGRVVASLEKERTNSTLEWGNGGFVAPGFELEESFLENVRENFNATVRELDFAATTAEDAASEINEWVREATRGNVPDLVDASMLSSDVVMVLAGAVYFKGIWNAPFRKCETRDEEFRTGATGESEKVRVPFMRQEGRFAAGENAELGVAWVELPFEDEDLSMIFVLPDASDGLDSVLEKFSGADLERMIAGDVARRVKLNVPKFKLKKTVSLVEILKKLGLTDVFTERSDLKGISSAEKNLRLSGLIHGADVEIDEDGSTAAAATIGVAQTLNFEWLPDELDFKADHPFLFFIVDKSNRIPIFAGKMVNPQSSSSLE